MPRMLDAAVEIAIAVFLSWPDAGDGELEERLTAAGVAPWLAARLVLFLPLAFGRLLLTDCNLSPRYSVGDEQHALADDPVWVAAAQRARRAVRDEVGALAPRSAEVSAVGEFLTKYPKRRAELAKGKFSPPTLVSPLPPLEPGDGGVPSPALAFRQFLEGHGHAVQETSGELGGEAGEAGGELAAGELRFGAWVYPHANRPKPQLQVDFTVAHPALAVPQLRESFAGFGDTWGDAARQTIVKFERNSMHVLIAALLDHSSCAEQVEWEPLGDAEARFEICYGGMMQTFGAGKIPLLAGLIDALKAKLAASPPSLAAHGLRVFLAHDGTQLSMAEVLLDNDPWEAGQQLAEAMDFSTGPEAWGVRWFAMVLPRRPAAG